MPAPPKNQNAAKPPGEGAESQLQIRCRTADKAAWVQAAQARLARDPSAKPGLAAWVIDTLNAAAQRIRRK